MRVPRMWGVDRDHRASLGRQGVHGETDREPRGGVLDVVGGGGGGAAGRRGAPGLGGGCHVLSAYGLARPSELKNAL